MQLTANHRREVIEDLLDIKIFSSMNSLIKDKIRGSKEEIKVLSLKKESLNDKVKMQEEFMEELEQGVMRILRRRMKRLLTFYKRQIVM
jgi:DNA repair exonuclease SbcCD ATPase subunit